MRNKLFSFILRVAKHQQGYMLPFWLQCVRAIIFPIDFLYWRISRTTGYQIESDTWLIGGIRFSGNAMRDMSQADGQLFRITRQNDVVIFERISGKE